MEIKMIDDSIVSYSEHDLFDSALVINNSKMYIVLVFSDENKLKSFSDQNKKVFVGLDTENPHVGCLMMRTHYESRPITERYFFNIHFLNEEVGNIEKLAVYLTLSEGCGRVSIKQSMELATTPLFMLSLNNYVKYQYSLNREHSIDEYNNILELSVSLPSEYYNLGMCSIMEKGALLKI